MKSRRFLSLIVVVMAVMAALAVPVLSYAASGQSVVMVGQYTYMVSGEATTDDGNGYDYICVACYNADGTLNDIDIWGIPVGYGGSLIDYCSTTMSYKPIYPLSVSISDRSSVFDFSTGENGPAGATYCGLNAGSDLIDLTGAVVGTVVTTTAIYSAPDMNSATATTLDAGKTVYVFGKDASGKFYKVELSGQFFWVPVGTMGPDYDNVWNGAPLPTTVVK